MKEIVPFGRAVCYSGYRKNQGPGEKIYPSKDQILEDLTLIVRHKFKYIRMYDANEYAERVCEVITENEIPLKLMLGTGNINEVNNTNCEWNKTVYTDEQLAERRKHNEDAVERLCKLAQMYPDVIFCVSIGNENTPDWGENTVPVDRLIIYAEKLRRETGKPVTFNEGALEWPKLGGLVEHLDFISIHSYPLWYGLKVEDALAANKKDYENIKSLYPNKQILISEAGWATKSLNGTRMIDGEACEENEVKYYKDLWDWTDKEKITTFVFEAFDEPWKGSGDPDEAEKHWGLYNEDRTPKLVVKELLK